MVASTPNPNPNAFIRGLRSAAHTVGFQKLYNFILWFIFAGALFGFCLARLEYLSVGGIFRRDASPGEWFYYSRHFYRVGITLHLACVIPAGLLAILQFIPAIRHKARLFHRINGYAAVLLLTLGIVGALMIARRAFGGGLAIQAWVGATAILALGSALLAYINIKRLQIDQHRAWMLRCWFYTSSIITLRVILIISAQVISSLKGFYIAMPCGQIAYMGGNATRYPACREDMSTGYAAVKGDLATAQGPEQAAASLQLSFGMAAWLALLLHAVGIEVYLRLTPIEGERLRQVSYERQLERGFTYPGSAGLTTDRLGDAERWAPKKVEEETGFKDMVSDGEQGEEVQKPARTMRMRGSGHSNL